MKAVKAIKAVKAVKAVEIRDLRLGGVPILFSFVIFPVLRGTPKIKFYAHLSIINDYQATFLCL